MRSSIYSFATAATLMLGLMAGTVCGDVASFQIRSNGLFSGDSANVTVRSITDNAGVERFPDFPGGTFAEGAGLNLNFTIDNLDLDSDGTSTESVDFTVSYATAGGSGSFNTTGFVSGPNAVDGLTVSVSDVAGFSANGGAAGGGSAIATQFDGFSEVIFFVARTPIAGTTTGGTQSTAEATVNGDVISFSSVNATGNSGQNLIEGITLADQLVITSADNDSGGGFSFRFGAVNFSAVAVPEPSSVLALGLVTAVGMVRRRR